MSDRPADRRIDPGPPSPPMTFGRGKGDPTGPPQRARTSAEMYFAVSLVPCPHCGSRIDPHALHLAGDGDAWALWGACAHCGTMCAFTFLTYGRPWEGACPPGELGWAAPSEIIAPAQFLAEYERLQGLVRPEPASLPLAEWRAGRDALQRLLVCLRELLKFVEPGAAAILDADIPPAHAEQAWLNGELQRYLALQARVLADIPRVDALMRAERQGRQPRGRLSRATLRAHEAWLKRGRQGSGRLVLKYLDPPFEPIGAADLSGALLEGLAYAGVDLGFARLEDAELRRVDLSGAILTDTAWRGARISGGSFRGAQLALAGFEAATIQETDFSGANLDRSWWTGAQVRGARFAGARFGNARLDGALFQGCGFLGADLAPTTASPPATTRGARFEECDLRDTNWVGRDLDGAVFVRCRLEGARGGPPPADDGARTEVFTP